MSESRPVNRIVAYGMPFEWKENHFRINVQYIIDSGDLLQNVQTRYVKTMNYKNKTWDEIYEILRRYKKSSYKVRCELEEQLRMDGATPFNAKKTAKYLLFGNVIGPRR